MTSHSKSRYRGAAVLKCQTKEWCRWSLCTDHAECNADAESQLGQYRYCNEGAKHKEYRCILIVDIYIKGIAKIGSGHPPTCSFCYCLHNIHREMIWILFKGKKDRFGNSPTRNLRRPLKEVWIPLTRYLSNSYRTLQTLYITLCRNSQLHM